MLETMISIIQLQYIQFALRKILSFIKMNTKSMEKLLIISYYFVWSSILAHMVSHALKLKVISINSYIMEEFGSNKSVKL